MTENRRADHLGHMLEAARLARRYVEGMSKEQFLSDTRTQQAVIMNLIIIGEAATRLLDDDAAFVEAHAEVPWKNMKGMRNRIVHSYFDTNLDVVWETMENALPDLCERLRAIQQNL